MFHCQLEPQVQQTNTGETLQVSVVMQPFKTDHKMLASMIEGQKAERRVPF